MTIEINVGIKGQNAEEAIQELLAIEDMEGSYEILTEQLSEEQRKKIAIIASIVSIASGTFNIAEKLYQWNHNQQRGEVEQVEIKYQGRRLMLNKDTRVDEIQKFLEDQKGSDENSSH